MFITSHINFHLFIRVEEHCRLANTVILQIALYCRMELVCHYSVVSSGSLCEKFHHHHHLYRGLCIDYACCGLSSNSSSNGLSVTTRSRSNRSEISVTVLLTGAKSLFGCPLLYTAKIFLLLLP